MWPFTRKPEPCIECQCDHYTREQVFLMRQDLIGLVVNIKVLELNSSSLEAWIRKESARTMATIEEVQQSIANLSNRVTSEGQQVSAALAEQSAVIQALKDQIASGSPVLAEQLDEVKNAIDAQAERVGNILPDAPAPEEAAAPVSE